MSSSTLGKSEEQAYEKGDRENAELMERFSEVIKRKYADFRLEEVEATMDRLMTRVVPESDGYMLSPGSMAPAMVFDLLQCGLRRTIELTDAAIKEINVSNMTTSCVLSRAAFETECLVCDAMRRVKVVACSGDTKQLTELYEYLKKVSLGGRSKYKISDVESVSILTAIQRVSKDFEDVPWELYETLSEHAHPNYHGMLATYTEIGKPACITTFVDRRPGRLEAATLAALGAICNGLDILEIAFESYDNFIDALAVLAERRNHEAGEWPNDLPYPLVRPLKWKMPGEDS